MRDFWRIRTAVSRSPSIWRRLPDRGLAAYLSGLGGLSSLRHPTIWASVNLIFHGWLSLRPKPQSPHIIGDRFWDSVSPSKHPSYLLPIKTLCARRGATLAILR
jgi:hypothetical protein